ncbi:hypothetical protein [Allopusillimonas ginsengisoli]|uniref:hypothetical protein n=1 Tax=Allopusillimonas ginsengisoli TaxID=453575 RepID=UPI001021430F|nr:hypothetical protein [Allopusillimonas ginsengisoli]TEA71955.1 hypothetical protein ERE07_19945 [Allopusillimonas ginsengisoli]
MANKKLLAAIQSINTTLGVPTLAEYGVEYQRFTQVRELMAQQALASGSPDNNPRVPSADEIVALYDSLWE